MGMSPAEGDAMNEHRFRLDVIHCVIEQVKSLYNAGLTATLLNALRCEEKGRPQAQPAVADALLRERETDLSQFLLARSSCDAASRNHKRDLKTLGQR